MTVNRYWMGGTSDKIVMCLFPCGIEYQYFEGIINRRSSTVTKQPLTVFYMQILHERFIVVRLLP